MRRTTIEVCAVAVFVTTIVLLIGRNVRLREECEQGKRNTDALLSDIEVYKVRDSLNAAKCYALELELSDYERYRAEDAALIADLKIKKRDLERITAAQMVTINDLSVAPRDTVIIRDSVPIPAVTLTIRDKWYDFDGLLADGQFTGQVTSRDSLIVVESVKMSRCIIKKWRRVKERSVNIISKNPNTKITDVEYILIEK